MDLKMNDDNADNRIEIGQLVSINWKLGLAVSSDECKNLNFPFITITLTTSDASSNKHLHIIEMTLSQFKNFHNQLKEMAKALEAV